MFDQKTPGILEQNGRITRVVMFLYFVFLTMPAKLGSFTIYRVFLASLVIVALFSLAHRRSGWGPREIRVVLLAVIMFASGVLGSFHFGQVELGAFGKMALNVVVLAAVIQLARGADDFLLVLRGLAVGGSITALTGIYGVVVGFSGRAVGIVGNANQFGQVCTLTSICLVGLAASSRKVSRGLIWCALIPPSLAGLLLSGSRGASVALLVSILAFFWFQSRRGLIVLFAGMVVFVGVFVAPADFAERWSKAFTEHKFERVSAAEARLELVRRGWRVYKHYPVAGVGFGNVRAGMGRVEVESNLVTHNVLVQAMAETGTVGAFCFLVLVGITAINIYPVFKARRSDVYARATMGTFFVLLVMECVAQLFSGNYIHPIWFVLFGVGASIRRYCGEETVAGSAPIACATRIKAVNLDGVSSESGGTRLDKGTPKCQDDVDTEPKFPEILFCTDVAPQSGSEPEKPDPSISILRRD